MGRRPATKLHLWILEKGYTDQQFADRMSIELGGASVSASIVRKWRLGVTMPRKRKLSAINVITDGAVTAESFVEAEGP